MKSLLWLIAVFAAAVAFVVLGRVDAGYVLFVFPPYRVEVTMLFFALAAIAAFFALYALVRLLGQILALPATVRAYRARRRRERAHGALAAALQAYYEGRYRRAEKEAAVAFEIGPVPGLAPRNPGLHPDHLGDLYADARGPINCRSDAYDYGRHFNGRPVGAMRAEIQALAATNFLIEMKKRARG